MTFIEVNSNSCDQVSLSILHQSTCLNKVVNHPIEDVSCSLRRWRAGRPRWVGGCVTVGLSKGTGVEVYCCVECSLFSCRRLHRRGRESSYLGGGVLQGGAGDTQLEDSLLVPRLRSHHGRSGLCLLLLQLLSGRLCFPDNHCFCHQHVRVLLLGLLDCHGEGLMLVHIIISCDYNPFLDSGL